MPSRRRPSCSVRPDWGSLERPLERAAARIRREAGGRVTTHTFLSDMKQPSHLDRQPPWPHPVQCTMGSSTPSTPLGVPSHQFGHPAGTLRSSLGTALLSRWLAMLTQAAMQPLAENRFLQDSPGFSTLFGELLAQHPEATTAPSQLPEPQQHGKRCVAESLSKDPRNIAQVQQPSKPPPFCAPSWCCGAANRSTLARLEGVKEGTVVPVDTWDMEEHGIENGEQSKLEPSMTWIQIGQGKEIVHNSSGVPSVSAKN